MGTSPYPRLGFRLAPRSLQEILDVPVLDSQIEQPALLNLKCSELDENSWVHFNRRTCRELGKVIVRQTSAQLRSLPKEVLTRPLPVVPQGIQLDDLDLEPRTRHCLQQIMASASLARLDELSKVTIGQILRTNGFGARCLVDLLSSLEGVAVASGQTEIEGKSRNQGAPNLQLDERLTNEAAHLRQIPHARSIRLDDPRLAKCLREVMRYAASIDRGAPPKTQDTIVDVADRIANRTCDPPNPTALRDRIRVLRRYIVLLSRRYLEKELRGIATPIGDQRAANIFLRYWGWDGSDPCTLHAAKAEFGISQSRIGQICAHFAKHLATKAPYLPALDKALSVVRAYLPAPACEIELALIQHRLTKKHFRLEGLLCAAKFFNRPALFEIETSSGERIAVPAEGAGITREITRIATQAITRCGTATLRDVTERVKEKASFSVSPELVAKILQSRGDLQWLDREDTWFWLSSVPHNPLVNSIRKVLSVSAHIDVDEVLAAVSHSIRPYGPAIPRQVFLELCCQLPMCHVLGDTVLAAESINPRSTLSNSEFHMFRILKDRGPLLKWRSFRALCSAAGMKVSTFNKTIRESPIIVRYAAGIYGIISAHDSISSVDAFVPGRCQGAEIIGLGTPEIEGPRLLTA
jgi:hypothetical protein